MTNLTPRSEIFRLYWYLTAERQSIWWRKLAGQPAPWTSDPIFQQYKFCNTYRINDRETQFLVREVIYNQPHQPIDLLLRILLFRLLNKGSTWQALEQKLGYVGWSTFNWDTWNRALLEIQEEQGTIYGNAFILCATKQYGHSRKHQNHLSLLQEIFTTDAHCRLLTAPTLATLFERLRELPLLGPFMAYQIAIDLNYSELFDFSENDFTVAGPGALRGIKKCFPGIHIANAESIIMDMVENQEHYFRISDLEFRNLYGRPLQAIDCQGLFCELDKYTRVSHPQLASARSRIKSKYQPTNRSISFVYPPKWRLRVRD